MKHNDKIEWMAVWAAKNGAALELDGECGFGRECVGILAGDSYPSYEWFDDETYERLDTNGDIFTPVDAYHKSPCVAVLGRGEGSESQLYDWIKWFHDNGFTVEKGFVDQVRPMHPIELMLGKHKYARMVKVAE